MSNEPKYTTLEQLFEGYKKGEIPSDVPLMLDNDSASVAIPTGPEDDEWKTSEGVFEMHPGTLLRAALDMLGIPHEHV